MTNLEGWLFQHVMEKLNQQIRLVVEISTPKVSLSTACDLWIICFHILLFVVWIPLVWSAVTFCLRTLALELQLFLPPPRSFLKRLWFSRTRKEESGSSVWGIPLFREPSSLHPETTWNLADTRTDWVKLTFEPVHIHITAEQSSHLPQQVSTLQWSTRNPQLPERFGLKGILRGLLDALVNRPDGV